jgi:hypothetical protein
LRSSGVQEFRSSGVQEFRSSGVQEFRIGRPTKLQDKISSFTSVCDHPSGLDGRLLNSCNS